MTYTYIEAKSNYHRGSILILRWVQISGLSSCWFLIFSVLSYLVLIAGFYFAPHTDAEVEQGQLAVDWQVSQAPASFLQSIKIFIISSYWSL